jgi:hypothetical protein
MQDEPELEHVFVKKVVTLAMDRHDRERELASVLLSSLYGEVLSSGPGRSESLFESVFDACCHPGCEQHPDN